MFVCVCVYVLWLSCSCDRHSADSAQAVPAALRQVADHPRGGGGAEGEVHELCQDVLGSF